MAVEMTDIQNAIVKIKVLGVGGGGNNVLLRLKKDGVQNVDLIGINTDAKQLRLLAGEGIEVLQIGERLTKGRGTGGVVSLGEEAAIYDERALREAMAGADLIFLTCCMGGGCGTGAAPYIARLAREMNILTVGVVTTPFSFEGKRKMQQAAGGIVKLQANMDGLIIVHNNNLMKLQEYRQLKFTNAFEMTDNILRKAVSCITEMILTTGVINVDFADVSTIFRQSESSDAILGIGENAQGYAVQALQQALESPLIERRLEGARGIILNITGAHHLSLYEVTEVSSYIYENTHDDVNIIFGVVIDPQMGETVRATLIATDFADSAVVREPQLRPIQQPESQPEQKPEETAADTAAKAAEGGLSVPDFMNRRASAGATAAQPATGFNAFGGIPRFQLSTERKPN